MDIRNFFGKPKSKSSGGATSSSVQKHKSPIPSRGDASAAASKNKSSAAAQIKTSSTAKTEDSNDDGDSDMEEVASAATNEKKRKESPSNANSANANRRKIIVDSSSDDGDDIDYDEPSSKKAASPSRSPPPSQQRKPSQKPAAKAKAAPVKRSPKKQADDDIAKPPKFHPPSSQLSEHILTSGALTVQIQSTLPRLPPRNRNFSSFIDAAMTPRCLSGLTFCFTGILSTNDDIARATNAAVSLASPSKADYYRNRQFDHTPTAPTHDDNLRVNNNNDYHDNNFELSRDNATDIVKTLGGRVTMSVSSKTDYLIAGNILEDGRQVVDGSKYKKCLELWNDFKMKQLQEQGEDNDDEEEEESAGGGSPNKKQKTATSKKKTTAMTKKSKSKTKKKPLDPNALVEIIRGLDEFYALIYFLSQWKRGTLTDEERRGLELQQRQQREEENQQRSGEGEEKMMMKKEETDRMMMMMMIGVKDEKKEEDRSVAAEACVTFDEVKAPAPVAAPPPAAAANPYATKPLAANPYSSKPAVANPYTARKPMANNPYSKKQPVTNNSYATPSANFNPYAKKPPHTALSGASKPDHHVDPKNSLGPNSLWADKYAPKSTDEILGNKTNVDKLARWLDRWEGTFNNSKMSVKTLTAPNGPWKAALLSGPPGIGKTTTATLIAKQSGRDVLELNASDARSKKALSEALGDVTGSQVLSFANQSSNKHLKPPKRVIIMDEVDGMGAGDRSGMAELIQMIKKSKVPIICICNDRQSQKVKSLAQYCLDLRYQRPVKTVIARRAVEIGRMEGMEVEPNAAEAIAESCGNDIRQVLNCLQMWSCKKNTEGDSAMTYKDLKDRKEEINKDEVLRVSMFDACRRIVEGNRGVDGTDLKAVTTSLMNRSDAYFVDYMLMGLMVHQNYLKVCSGQFNKAKLSGEEIEEVSALNELYNAAQAMSDFAVVEENLRGGDQNWALLPLSSMLAVKVGHHAGGPNGGFLPGNAEFTAWLGKNSTRNKMIRLLGELRHHMNYKVSADSAELRMNYLPLLRKQFQELLFDSEKAKVKEAIDLMDDYGLDRDDIFENLDEFVLNSGGIKEKKFADLDSKSKAAFTREYNSMAHRAQALVSEQGASKTTKKKGGGSETEEVTDLDAIDDDKNAVEQESDDEGEEEDMEALKKKFLKKGKGKANAAKVKKSKKQQS